VRFQNCVYVQTSSLNAEEKLVHDFFVAYMDTDTINDNGIAFDDFSFLSQ